MSHRRIFRCQINNDMVARGNVALRLGDRLMGRASRTESVAMLGKRRDPSLLPVPPARLAGSVCRRRKVNVARFLAAVDNLKHRMVLTVCYATGLRISEAVRLTPSAIDSKRMVIRVEQGKGGKDRYVMLSPRLLDMLRNYWDRPVPGNGSFPVDGPENRSLHPASMPPAGRSDNGAASANRSRRIRCATPSPFTFSRPAPTYVPSSCCSVIAISPPRPGIS